MQENEAEFSDMMLCRSTSLFSVKSAKSKKVNDIRNPIKINKKELKIPYTKKTPIYGHKGFHLERDISNEENLGFFTKLVENKSVKSFKSDNSEGKRVRILNQALPTRATTSSYKNPTHQAITKPLSAVIIKNKSKSIENVDILLRKSEMSSKNNISRLESENPFNYDSISQASELSSDAEPRVFDESMILDLIVKSKCGNSAGGCLSNSFIELKHRTTPFDDNFLSVTNIQRNNMQSQASDVSTIHRELSFLDTKKKAYLNEVDRLRNYEVSQYYFKNMQELRQKLYKSTDKVLISQSSAPNNSNELFNRIEKFDVAEKYKKEYFKEAPEVRQVLFENKNVVEEIRNRPIKSAYLKGFQSMRDFRLEPENGPVPRLYPPLMKNRFPKKEPDYYRHKYLSSNRGIFDNFV